MMASTTNSEQSTLDIREALWGRPSSFDETETNRDKQLNKFKLSKYFYACLFCKMKMKMKNKKDE